MAGGREQGMAEGQAAYAWRRLPNAFQKASAKGLMGFPSGTVVKNMPDNAGDARVVVSISGSGRSPGEGNGNPLQYSCLGKFQGQRSLAGCSPWGHSQTWLSTAWHRGCRKGWNQSRAIRGRAVMGQEQSCGDWMLDSWPCQSEEISFTPC